METKPEKLSDVLQSFAESTANAGGRDSLAGVYRNMAAQAKALEQEIEAFHELKLKSLSIENEGHFKLDARMQGHLVSVLAMHLGEMLDGCGAENCVEVQLCHPRLGDLVLSIRRRLGKTEMQLRGEALADSHALQECLQEIVDSYTVTPGSIAMSQPASGWDAWLAKARKALSGHTCLKHLEHIKLLTDQIHELRQCLNKRDIAADKAPHAWAAIAAACEGVDMQNAGIDDPAKRLETAENALRSIREIASKSAFDYSVDSPADGAEAAT